MGAQQSKEELLYQQTNYGNIEGIKDLREDGACLEWIDKEGKTPLILACTRPDLLVVVKVLIELGANVNAYRPGRHAGTPLHHAARRGLEQTVNLLLSYGANPLVMNDDRQTPLDLARAKGHCSVVRAIESRTCLFSGWLREVYGPSILEAPAPQWASRKIWAVVLPCDSCNVTNPRKFNLAIYPDVQAAQPRVVISLWKVHIEDPNFNLPDPALVIIDKDTRKSCNSRGQRRRHRRPRHMHHLVEDQRQHMHHRSRWRCTGPQSTHITTSLNIPGHETRYEFLSAYEGNKQQLQWFYNACTGIIHATASAPTANRLYLDVHIPTASTSVPASSAPAVVETVYDDAIQYPSTDSSPVNSTAASTENESDIEMSENREGTSENRGGSSSSSGSCVVCLDASVEGACIPCGHMAGCMACLNEIEAKKWGCPVCRAKIDQIVRLYAV